MRRGGVVADGGVAFLGIGARCFHYIATRASASN